MSDEALNVAREWIRKAEGDWTIVRVMSRQMKCPFDHVCFHCQQYVEKLLKGLLTIHGLEVPKTHDLKRLVYLAGPVAPEILALATEAPKLSEHAVDSRYPELLHRIGENDMREMIAIAERFAAILLPRVPRPGTDHVEDPR